MSVDIVLAEEFSEREGIYRKKGSLTLRVELPVHRIESTLVDFCKQWHIGYYRIDYTVFRFDLRKDNKIGKVCSDLEAILDTLEATMLNDDM